MSGIGWLLLALVNIPVYYGLGRLFFDGWEDFEEAIGFWLTPDIISAFRGEFETDWWAEFKLGLWFALCVGCVFGEAHLIGKFFG